MSKIFYPRKEEIVRKGLVDFFGWENDEKKRISVEVPSKYASSSLFALFDKTEGDIVCPHFWEFKPLVGCPFNCSYCYLNGTLFGKKNPRWKADRPGVISGELDRFLDWADNHGLKLLLNTGEVADSLAVPEFTEKLIEETLPVLKKHKVHKILLLTKGGVHHIKPLLKAPQEVKEFFIVSFSVNTPGIAERFEIGATKPEDRIEAARILRERGFTVRIRIDPMIPYHGWRADYPLLAHYLIVEKRVIPERITLGSLRGLKKTIKFAKDKKWIEYLDKKEKTKWGLKIEKKLRLEMYEIMITKLKEFGYKGPIALCKETHDVWKELVKRGLLEDPGEPGFWENVKCNCKL